MKPGGKSTLLQVVISPDMKHQLQLKSQEQGLSLSSKVRMLIAKDLKEK